METWNRRQLWAEHDAAHLRGSRLRVVVVTIGLFALWNTLAVVGYSRECRTAAHLEPMLDTRNECAVDDDCVLVPELVTCCGECDAVPPFEAAPWTMVDEIRRDAEAACAPRERFCDPPICASAPAGCEARPICRAGQCVVEANERCQWPR